MNICMITYSFYEADNRVMRYAETLAAHGNHVEVFSLGRPGAPRHAYQHGVEIFHLQERQRDEKGAVTYLLRILRFLFSALFTVGWRHLRNRYNVVHVHSIPDFLVFAALIPKLGGAGVILDIHDILPELYASKFRCGEQSRLFRILCAVERISARFADRVIVANDIWRERLIARSVTSERCTTFLNYPNRRIFHPGQRKRDDGKLIFMYPGSLHEFQGLHVAIRAFSQIATALPEAEFHIYGEGGSILSLRALVEELSLAGRVQFFPTRPLREIALVMAQADIAVVPKLAESFADTALSTKILEFMSLGIPVIASSTSIERYYFNGSVLSFFESGNVNHLARQMMRLASSPELRQRQVEHASVLLERFDWDVLQFNYLALVDAVAGAQPFHDSGSFIQDAAECRGRRGL